ncbi:aromatic ring-hydroxylating oxygenase subunit alpha [Rhodoplanes roseus]|uniref:Biphenyl 2,3-dioxygenase n=1 Tax=Rhodoplanes roseus TaxID=29409 RepID=A0A327L2E6_9BRAD|nr:Rieske 2Fe-2S domain-containing protein [Rhodoplanes roseus]RAI44424.1 biphenyl 2,3-dioxygenase [Rhodoplanes roseus]
MTNTSRFDPDDGATPDDVSDLRWPADPAEIPDWIYTDRRIYDLEQARIFRGHTWNYVALDVELPQPGDYIRSYIGDTPIIVARDADGRVRAFENRCAHRGAEFCKSYRGSTKQFVCPYHQWTYDLSGALVSVPFRRGVKGLGGMPADFELGAHNLRSLNVTTRHGVVFASFQDDIESFEDYLGPEMLDQFDTVFDGRTLKLLGVHRNTLQGNWKLYQENLKDPYHATLLHTYLTTFGLFVAGNKTMIMTDAKGRHSTLCNARPQGRPDNDPSKSEIRSFHAAMQLADPRVIQLIPEKDSPWTSNAITIWPNLILLRQTNILGARQIVPMGPNQFMLIWTTFGFADDSPEMEQHRLRQNNIFGPGGFIGIDDNEAIKFVQDGVMRSVPRHGVAPLGKDEEGPDVVITDRAIRSMYRHYRAEMGL